MKKIVCFINGFSLLSICPFLKETKKQYKYLGGSRGGWEFSSKKENIIYVGEETTDLKLLKAEFDKKQKELEKFIKEIKQKQKEIIQKINYLPTNTNKFYKFDVDFDKLERSN